MSPENINDHDLLMEIKTNQIWLMAQFNNHLKHHFLITLGALGAAFSSISALIVFIITK